MSFGKLIASILSVVVLGATASAQPRFCMGGDLEQLTAAQQNTCKQQMAQMQVVAAAQHSPDWHYVLVCDEQGWSDYAAFSMTSPAKLQNALADTNFAEKTTFVRGSRLSTSLTQAFGLEVANIVRQSNIQVASLR